MFRSNYTLPTQTTTSTATTHTAHYDLSWGRPVFRAPELPAKVSTLREAPFKPARLTGRKAAVRATN